MSDIIADIDALIDEQLSKGEPLNGYDYGDPQHPKCSHCHRDWHGLAITQRIEQLRSDWQRAQSRGPADCGCFMCEAIERELELDRGQDSLAAATKALDEYRYASDDSEVLCPGSDFIGPWATSWQLQKIRDGWPDEQLWALPDNPFDSLAWTRRMLNWVNPVLPASYQYGRLEGRGASPTYSVVDETLSLEQQWGNSSIWRPPFIDAVPAEPRPWMWVPRERAFPAYTVEKSRRSSVWTGNWDLVSEHFELRITGTLPELVDATIDTPGAIPWWATDVDTLTRRAIEPWPRRTNPRAYLDPWMAEVVSSWALTGSASWQITVGGQAPANREVPPLPSVTREREEPPMWALDATRRRRR